MIKNIKIQFIFLFGCYMIMNSCNTDEGNYDYNEINEVVFDGLLDNYVALRFDNLEISTDEVKFTEDINGSGSYEYSWEAVSKNVIDDNIYILSTDKNINEKLVLLPGEYTLYYIVKDLKTDVEFQYKTNLEVVNSIYKGWMVLNEVSGGSRLDMVTWLEGGEFKEIHDVLAFTESSLTLSGKPGFVECYPYQPNYYGIYVSTSGNGTTKLEPNTFDWTVGNNLSKEFASAQPEDLEASVLYPKSDGYAVTIANNNLYIYNRIQATTFNTPLNITRDIFGNTSPFEVSPYIGIGDDFGFYKMVFYDNTNKKFKYHDGRAATPYCYDLFYNQNGTQAAKVFLPGKDLVYMTWNLYGTTPFGAPAGTIFAVLKDPKDGKNYIGSFQSWYGWIPNSFSEITDPNFDQAENIAIDPTYAYIMYNIGSKVYSYDIFTKATKKMLDKGNLKITKLEYGKFIKNTTGSLESDLAKQLIVCTYDPAGSEGSNGVMELYKVPGVQGDLVLSESYSGFGKIVSVAYRAR